jgi:hypothetical protein
MPRHKVADSSQAQREQALKFRRKSVDAGGDAAFMIESTASMKLLSADEVKAVSIESVEALADSFILCAKGMKGNPEVKAKEWVNNTMPQNEVFAKKFANSLMVKSVPVFKMSRKAMLAKTLLVLLLTYNDEATDVKMLFTYKDGGKATERYFWISLVILIIPNLLSMAISIIQNSKKGAVAKVQGVVLTLLQLQPVMHAVAVWRGKEQTEEDVFHPFVLFMIARVGEIIFEVLPEV